MMYHVGLMTGDSAAEMAGGRGSVADPAGVHVGENCCCMMVGECVDCLLGRYGDPYWGQMRHELAG